MNVFHPMYARNSVFMLLAGFGLSSFGAEIRNASIEQRIAKLEAAAGGVNSGDNAWMLTSAALVLMMTAPGLILFYGGLVRAKNVLGTMMHSLFLMGIASIVWAVFGYSMAFGEGSIVGSPMQYFMLKGVGEAPNADYAGTIPHQSFMLFQMMFAIITPALITGAFAERMKFSAFVLFVVGWLVLVYFPLAHMVWGKGGIFNWALGGKIPVLDFAGGTVVHISSGFSALVCAIVLGKRIGFPNEPMPPHNVVFTLLGAGMLWVGWFGFNAGSAVSAGGLATKAFAATHFSAAAAALSWGVTEWILKGRPSVLGVASGMVAGLATITPASGFVTVTAAIVIGLVAGVVCYMSVTKLKSICGYDDSLDVFGVHGMGSVIGMIACGLAASVEVNPLIASTFQVNGVARSLAGSLWQLKNQLIGIAVAAGLGAIVTFVLLKVIDAVVGLRVDPEAESLGLDLAEHGEKAYND
ncbi:MAG TPA: ammonium transporter [Verrucomicrobiae bacterium]|nr:ammonium transporter [Verrucomicrobiae bacterium]